MEHAAAYREREAIERGMAAAAALPNRRAMHERAAEAWAMMAMQIEDTVARTIVNAAAKAAR